MDKLFKHQEIKMEGRKKNRKLERLMCIVFLIAYVITGNSMLKITKFKISLYNIIAYCIIMK